MTKAILFDLDGLVIKKQEKLFSERFAEMQKIPLEKVAEFFNGDFRECTFGRADLKEKIAPFFPKWNYEGTIDEFLKIWFESENELDKKILEIVKKIREKGIKCFLATRQEKYRKEYIWEKLGLKNYFDGMFCTCDIGYDKWQKEYWIVVLNELKLEPGEVMFFCDSEKNIENAGIFGINSYLFTGISSINDNIKDLL